MMIRHIDIDAQTLRREIRRGVVVYAGNAKLGIYGKLNCWSGKRMKRQNRVFFVNEKEALSFGFRACRHCMKKMLK